jgi:N-methylhydantoinase B/oxoprolinase/acetone carboxylase alpha subunit
VVALDGAVVAAQGSGGYGRRDGGCAGQWRLRTAQQWCKMVRRQHSMEQQWHGGEDGVAQKVEDEQEKKSNRRGYIKIRSPVNPMRHRRERRCKSRVG